MVIWMTKYIFFIDHKIVALNSLSLNFFPVSISQSGFLRFVTKNPDWYGKNKGFESSNAEFEEEWIMSEQA